jgi:hypothetical protein
MLNGALRRAVVQVTAPALVSLAVVAVIVAVHAGHPQPHKRTDDGRSTTSAAGSRYDARHERIRAEPDDQRS